MHIRVILPVTAKSLAKPILDEARLWASPDTKVDLVRITHGPESIESEYDEALATTGVLEAAQQATSDGVDGLFISCFAEPAVHAAREVIDVPVVGGLEPAVHAALGVADRIAILSILPDTVPAVRRKLASYQLLGRVPVVREIDVPVLGLDSNSCLLDRLEHEANTVIEAGAADAFVLGCTGMLKVAHELQRRLTLRHGNTPVVDPTGSAILNLETAVRLGISPSRLSYHPPRTKRRDTSGCSLPEVLS